MPRTRVWKYSYNNIIKTPKIILNQPIVGIIIRKRDIKNGLSSYANVEPVRYTYHYHQPVMFHTFHR